MERVTRGIAVCVAAWACAWLAACERAPVVEALPLPDAEPPVVIIGPGRDSGVKAKKGKDAAAGKGKDAAVALAGRDAAAAIVPGAPIASASPLGRDAAVAREGARPSDPASREAMDDLDQALGRIGEDDEDDDEVPTYVLDERASASATPTPRDSPSPSPSASMPSGRVTTGARGPLLLADATRGRIDVMSREASLLGRIDVGGAVVRGVAHDRRAGDGVWVLLAGSPPMIAKLGWDGRRLRAFEVKRPPLRRARAFVGIDHVLGHAAGSDLLLVLYINKLGLPVVEGLLARDGSSRFSVGFSREADVSGVRADGFRHDTVDGLLVLDWWTIRQGQHLERWRFFYGFVDRLDTRGLDARIDAFDIPPWREVWGVDRAGRKVVRMSGDGDVVQTYPSPDIEPAFVAISP